jgi:hypothetical protein
LLTIGKVKTFITAFLFHALILVGLSAAVVPEPSWKTSLRAELPRAKELGFGRGYDISGSRTHVPVTPLMADVFDAAPHVEIVTFLELLATDPDYREQKNYLLMCARALKEDEEPTRSLLKYADGRETAVVYYHIPFISRPKKETKKPIQPPQTTTGSSAPSRV